MAIKRDFKYINDKNIVIFDMSYFFYNKLNSISKFYMNQYGESLFYNKEKLKDYNWAADDDFVKCFTTFCTRDIEKYLMEHTSDWKHLIMARDCSKQHIWRRSYYPLYKENRIEKQLKDADDDTKPNFSKMWSYIYSIFVPSLVDQYGCYVASNDVCEGDDIIAICKELIFEKLPDKQIIINAYDSDLAQLVTSDKVRIINMEQKDVIPGIIEKYGSVADMVKNKVLSGDRKDNIKQLFDRCGIVTAKKLLADKTLLLETLKNTPGSIEHLKLNTLLLDLTKIPATIKSEVKADLMANCTIFNK